MKKTDVGCSICRATTNAFGSSPMILRQSNPGGSAPCVAKISSCKRIGFLTPAMPDWQFIHWQRSLELTEAGLGLLFGDPTSFALES